MVVTYGKLRTDMQVGYSGLSTYYPLFSVTAPFKK